MPEHDYFRMDIDEALSHTARLSEYLRVHFISERSKSPLDKTQTPTSEHIIEREKKGNTMREYTYGHGEVDGLYYIFYRESSQDHWQFHMLTVQDEPVKNCMTTEHMAEQMVKDLNAFEQRKSQMQERGE